ncbi:MAG: hypothetical protein HFE58_12965 [Firmicutes bacterium]|nr:hypothetical protein [Bacillota bacterium]
MKKKKLFSILCAVSLMSSMIVAPTSAEELDTIPILSENVVNEESDILHSESAAEDTENEAKEGKKIDEEDDTKENASDKMITDNKDIEQNIVLYDENSVIDKNEDIKISKNLELKSLDTLQTFSNEEFLADEVNHAPIAGLQYAVLNPDSLVDGQFTRETQLAFFWKWDNTLYTYDIDEGDTITAYIGGVPLENCVTLGGADYDFEGFAVIDLEPGDYELTFHVVDNHGAQSNVAHLSFSIIDTTEQPSPDITIFEDSLASAEDVKTYTVPVDFTQTPEVLISLIRTGGSGLKITVFDENENVIKEGSCYPNIIGVNDFSSYSGIYNKYSIKIKQPEDVQAQTYTIKVESYKDFKENDSNYKITVGSEEQKAFLTGGKENVTPLYLNIFNADKGVSRFYTDQDLPSTNPKYGDWYSFVGDGKMVFTIYQRQVNNDALRFQILDPSIDNKVIYDSAEDDDAHRIDVDKYSSTYVEKTMQTLKSGKRYYLVIYATREQKVSDEFCYGICIGDPDYVSNMAFLTADNIRFRKNETVTFTIPVNDAPDSVVMKYIAYHGSPTTIETTWYYRPESSRNWKPVYYYNESKFSVNWKTDNSTKLLGDWEFQMKGRKDITEDVKIAFGFYYERGDKYDLNS